MGKTPAFQFYPGDWSRDLEEHPLEIEGAWIRLCCKLWWSETRGSLTRTPEQWAKVLGVSVDDTKRIFDYINSWQIGVILTAPNGNITVESRRMLRDDKERVNNCLRQKRHYEKRKPNATPNGEPNIPSSSSSSTSKEKIYKKESAPKPPKITFDGTRFQNIPHLLMAKWKQMAPGISVPQEIAKAEAWAMANPTKLKSNWARFLTTWITNAQDKPKPYTPTTGGASYGRPYPNRGRIAGEIPPDVEADIERINKLSAERRAREAQQEADGAGNENPGADRGRIPD